MTDKLLSCPFCGGEAIVRGSIVTYNHVACRKCNSAMLGDTKEEAIKAWNTRPNPWHTGTPTEIEEDEYWKWNYALVLNTEYDCIGDYLAGLLFAPDFERQVFTAPQGGGKELIVPFKDVVAWQKIDPYKEEK